MEPGRSLYISGFGEFVDGLAIYLHRYFLAGNLDVITEPFVIAMWGSLHLADTNQAAGLALTGPTGVNLSFITESRPAVFFIFGMKKYA